MPRQAAITNSANAFEFYTRKKFKSTVTQNQISCFNNAGLLENEALSFRLCKMKFYEHMREKTRIDEVLTEE